MKIRAAGQRGLSLVESLVAFAIASVGMMALVLSEAGLRFHGDLVRQRAEAVRLAHQDVEHLRTFESLTTLDANLTAPGSRAVDLGSSARYELRTAIVEGDDALQAGVAARWRDRRGQDNEAALHTLVARIDPVLSGLLLVQPPISSVQLPQGRSLAVPPAAVDLGDGRSAFAPPGAAGIRWIFDNASGQVTSVCSRVSPDAERCTATNGWAVSGVVRFSTGPTVTPDDAEHPASPPLDLALQLDTPDGTATCHDDPSSGRDVGYHCLVQLAAGRSSWSGRLDVLPRGWTVGTAAAAYRVCRYSLDADGRDGVSNAEHPLRYRQVHAALQHQNFLVVRGPLPCPADTDRSRPSRSTVEQAPQPQETPAAG